MSNEELWELFPIILTEHQKDWERLYKLEEQQLRAIVGKDIVRIRHIGSTAVKDLIAKPTIDILLEIDGKTNIEELIVKIQSTGYIYTHQPENPAPHMMFMKGYTPQGFRRQAYHLHVRIFCHYLQSHPALAHEYGELKLKLKQVYEHDRDAYTKGKTEFIRQVVRLAREK